MYKKCVVLHCFIGEDFRAAKRVSSSFSKNNLILVKLFLVVVQLGIICSISFLKLAICGNNVARGHG